MHENFMLGGGSRGGMQQDYFIGSKAADDVVRPASPIEAAKNDLDEATGRLHNIVSELEQRLHMVLGPSAPQSVGVGAQEKPVAVTLARGIAMSASAVNAARERLESIISRLEL